MDTLREQQLTKRATRRPYEYNYTNADIHQTNVQPSDGYQFEYPVNWTGDPSTNKVIGLRRISYKPTSVNLAFTFHVKIADAIAAVPAVEEVTDPETGAVITPAAEAVEAVDAVYFDVPISACYTSENTFEEALAEINTTVNKAIVDGSVSDIRFSVVYHKDDGWLLMAFENTDYDPNDPTSPPPYYSFELEFTSGSDSDYDPSSADGWHNLVVTYYKREFLKLFNQRITKISIDALYNFNDTLLEFNNVWNRDTFYCHASFSDSPRKIIGINKDFWPTPSVFYEYSDNSNDFNIYFTTDTVHRILPRHGVLLIQISYIFNYQTSYLTYG